MTAADPSVPTLPMLRCAGCGHLDTPAHTVCRACLSADLRPVGIPATGRIVSFTTIRRAPSRFRDQAPYHVAVVDLDAGPRVTGRLAATSPAPALGARVRALRPGPADLLFTIRDDS
ncbi:MAG: OB-fold domain-containing protein [Rhodospirillales bacterium]|jgi:uncharacterized OB-fold protein|nr:OB-fold domain-containing protein [Rhodospirillales bacterium]